MTAPRWAATYLSAMCTATVDDAEGWSDAIGKDRCNFDINVCITRFSCVDQGANR